MKPLIVREDAEIYTGDVLDVLRKLPKRSVHMVVTSPPYWALRDYEVDGQIGAEKTPEEYVQKMVEVFRAIRRVLRNDGVCWLNLGDTFDSKTGNLIGIPWRVALALQADGWILRQDIIWCLSGGTWVYARTKKGDGPVMIRDLSKLNPTTVKLWNGSEWVNLLGMNKSKRSGNELELVLRSGERISCTPNHLFPTLKKGIVQASDLRIGDSLTSCQLPEPDYPRKPVHIGNDAAWLAGLYLADGSTVDTGLIQISGHSKKIERWERVRRIAKEYGGNASITVSGNNQGIRVSGKVICALIKELVSGKTAKDKSIAPVVWRYDNDFLKSYMEGYLSGDGHKDVGNKRWRIGFTRNYSLERDFRVACARLGWTLTLKTCFAKIGDVRFPSFKGEVRFERSGHFNQKNRNEIVEIRKARCREVWDLGVSGETNLFSLASGVLTHNSKPNCFPESVQNRCTKSHEYIFLLAKKSGYFFDAEAIKERAVRGSAHSSYNKGKTTEHQKNRASNKERMESDSRNRRSVWNISTESFEGGHFAAFPTKLVQLCIKAGTSHRGCCSECGSPWKRVTERIPLKRERPNQYTKRKPGKLTGGAYSPPGQTPHSTARDKTNTCANDVAGVEVRTIGWEPTCECKFYRLRNDAPSHIINELKSLGLV